MSDKKYSCEYTENGKSQVIYNAEDLETALEWFDYSYNLHTDSFPSNDTINRFKRNETIMRFYCGMEMCWRMI